MKLANIVKQHTATVRNAFLVVSILESILVFISVTVAEIEDRRSFAV